MHFPSAILFDLDDTIVTEGDRFSILLEIAIRFADNLSPYSPIDIANQLEAELDVFWSTPAKAKVARLGSHWGIRQARETVISDTFKGLGVNAMPNIAKQFSDEFTELRAMGMRSYTGAHEAVEALKIAGVKLALVTNGAADIQRAKIERFNLAPLFDHIQIEGEHGFGKPEKRAYTNAMRVLGVEPAQTWMVGDNLEWEVAVPQSLGIFGIWHDHKGKGLPPNSQVRPDRIIQRCADLLKDT